MPDDLTYRIRFQNTGSAAATNILVTNDIDPDLDISTFQPIASSHAHTTTITSPTEIKFTFLNINLADSTTDEPNSHGWILYKMKPLSTAVIGDTFENNANIFFDYNAPVITNTAITTVSATTRVPDDNFENYLETHDANGNIVALGATNSMGNGIANDNLVFTCNINTITSLNVGNKNIADLSGIEDFVALTELNCSQNQLLNLNISQNTLLEDLFVGSNFLTNLNLQQHTALNLLSCYDNQLTNLNLSQNTVLQKLACYNNQLTSLNVKNGYNLNSIIFNSTNNPNLLCIEVDDAAWSTTNWTNIDPASSFNTNCTNPETYVPDDNFENYLETHDTNGNIVAIGATNSMGNGIANDNYVTTANINTVTFLDVSSVGTIVDLTGIEDFTALDYLLCEGNQITSLDLSQNSLLTALFANSNQLTSLNMQNGNNTNVTSFMTGNNPNLNCIQVDDAVYSTTNWTDIDAQSSFSVSCSAISGVVSYNCTTPNPQQNVQIKATASISGNSYYTTTNNLGEYAFSINETGTIIIETAVSNLMATPANYTISYTGQDITAQDFCVNSITTANDVNVTLVPLTPAPRPGFASLYRIYYSNYGSTTVSGDVKFIYDDFKVGSVTSPDTFTQNGSELTWTYTNLAPFEIRHIDIELNINPATGTNAVNAGDYLLNSVVINPITGDIYQQDNFDETFEEVVNGYDPNDVTIIEGPYIQPNQSTDFLNFRLRFQNTGNASAINIEVKTTLDTHLDMSTFTLLGSSHTMNTSVTNQNDVSFDFPAINLDYATNNEPASHGWVTFKLKPLAGFAIGDIISSQASIFFDTNAPIITNTSTVQIAPITQPSQNQCAYVQVEAGETHTIALKADGTLWTWGNNTAGELGNGTSNRNKITTQLGNNTD